MNLKRKSYNCTVNNLRLFAFIIWMFLQELKVRKIMANLTLNKNMCVPLTAFALWLPLSEEEVVAKSLSKIFLLKMLFSDVAQREVEVNSCFTRVLLTVKY